VPLLINWVSFSNGQIIPVIEMEKDYNGIYKPLYQKERSCRKRVSNGDLDMSNVSQGDCVDASF
jgi:hypothetical protein